MLAGPTEFKFVTTKLSGFAPRAGEKYFNWADVSEMLSKYGSEGWRVSHMSSTNLGDDTVVYAFVLERAAGVAPARRAR